MKVNKEKVQKVNFGLFPSNIKKAKKLSVKLDRSISSLLRRLIDKAYSTEFENMEKSNKLA